MSALILVQENKYPYLKRWTRPDSYIGTEWNEYYRTGIGQTRDSDCLSRANFQAMLDALGGESETVVVVSCSHWACGWVQMIYVHESDTKSLETANKIMQDFENYPVIDDSLLCELENTELDILIENYQSEFRDEVCEIIGLEFDELSKHEQKEVDSFISYTLEYDRGYRGIDDAFITDDSIARAAENCIQYDETNGLNITELIQSCLGMKVEA